MTYLNSTSTRAANSGGPDAGQVLCKCSHSTIMLSQRANADRAVCLCGAADQNLAFRAVNQSIGRAIRHAGDWAAIVLLDVRYQQPSKRRQLPHWLGGDRVRVVSGFGGVMKELSVFVASRVGRGMRE